MPGWTERSRYSSAQWSGSQPAYTIKDFIYKQYLDFIYKQYVDLIYKQYLDFIYKQYHIQTACSVEVQSSASKSDGYFDPCKV